jgi:hypothetical protein
LLHPAHVLPPGDVSVGAGVSGQLALKNLKGSSAPSNNAGSLQNLSVAPGVAPWGAGRLGFAGSNEAGLTYSGREFRVDGRHAFSLGRSKTSPALSVGLGASAIVAQRISDTASAVYGGGADVPVLIGVRSTGDLYAVWFGPRAGFEILRGQLQFDKKSPLIDVSGRHFYGGLTAGLRVGFRHVYVAVEVNATYHHADGTFQAASTDVQQLTITPAGALQAAF